MNTKRIQNYLEKQETLKWGDGIIKQIELDLKLSMPNINGFSSINLKYMRRFYLFYSQYKEITKSQQLAVQLPWGHNMVILDKIKDPEMAIENGSQAYLNQSVANNFEITLPTLKRDLAKYFTQILTN